MARVPRKAATFVARWEGFSPKATNALDGIWTIGYGHTGGVRPGQTITKREALRLLRHDLRAAADAVDELVTVRLSSRQKAALISFTYNVGPNALAVSTLLRLVNAKAPARLIRAAFLAWNKANLGGGALVELEGLTRRRKAEAHLFND